MQRLQPYRVEPLGGPERRQAHQLLRAGVRGLASAHRHPHRAALPGAGRPGRHAAPGSRARKSTPCRRRRPRCAGARSPGWPTRSTSLMLHIQGSGRLRITEPDGSQRTVRVAFAGHQRAALPQRAAMAVEPGRDARSACGPTTPSNGWRRTRSACRNCCGAIRATCSSAKSRLTEVDAAFGPVRRAGRAADRRALDRGRPRQHSLRHAGLAGLAAARRCRWRGWWWRRTPAAPSSARCGPTTSPAPAPRRAAWRRA